MIQLRRILTAGLLGVLLLAGSALADTVYTAGETLAVGDGVKFNASGQVIKTTATTDVAIGVVKQAATSGQPAYLDTTDKATVKVSGGAAALQFLRPSSTPGVAEATANREATTFGQCRTAESGGTCEAQLVYLSAAAGGTHPVDLATDVTGTLPGTSVGNTPAGGIAATDVQGAINELDSEKAATAHTHTESDVTDLAHKTDLNSLDDVTITGPVADNELVAYDAGSGAYANQTAAEAGLSEVGHPHSGADITTGTVADARIDAALHRDAETKDGDLVAFDDADSNFTATNVDDALSELDDTNGSGPNAADGKVEWSQLVGVPAGFADGSDDTASLTLPRMGDLVLYAKLDEASGDRALTYGLNGPLIDNGTVTQGASLGIESFSAQFTAANSEYLSLSNANWVNQQPTNEFAVMCAFRVDSLPPSPNWLTIASMYNPQTLNISWMLVANHDGAIRFLLDSNGAYTTFDIDLKTSTGRVVTATNYLVYAQWDGVRASIWSFKVGTDSQAQFGAQVASATLAANGIHRGAADLLVGAVTGLDGTKVLFMDGRVEWLTIWNRAHSAQWIDWAFNGGSGRDWTSFN